MKRNSFIRNYLKIVYYCDVKSQVLDKWKHRKIHNVLMFPDKNRHLVFYPWASFVAFFCSLSSSLVFLSDIGEFQVFVCTIVTTVLFVYFIRSCISWYETKVHKI